MSEGHEGAPVGEKKVRPALVTAFAEGFMDLWKNLFTGSWMGSGGGGSEGGGGGGHH